MSTETPAQSLLIQPYAGILLIAAAVGFSFVIIPTRFW
ncbi:MAG: hypothetical protein JSU77_02780 [Fidelibacterota bacterium]|nr:MAG: hypothetical protein JSU77_02780 [Candidatus Neomarinimicrobiota bacterium]